MGPLVRPYMSRVLEDRPEAWQEPNVTLDQKQLIDFEIEREINDVHHSKVIYGDKSGKKQNYWL